MPIFVNAEGAALRRPLWSGPVGVAALVCLATFVTPARAAATEAPAAALGQKTAQPLSFQPPLMINGRTVTVAASTVDAATSRAMIQAVGRTAVPPAQPGRRNGLRAECALSGDASDPLVARMELNCDGWHVVFVRLCPKGQCRHELISRQFLPQRPIPSK